MELDGIFKGAQPGQSSPRSIQLQFEADDADGPPNIKPLRDRLVARLRGADLVVTNGEGSEPVTEVRREEDSDGMKSLKQLNDRNQFVVQGSPVQRAAVLGEAAKILRLPVQSLVRGTLESADLQELVEVCRGTFGQVNGTLNFEL